MHRATDRASGHASDDDAVERGPGVGAVTALLQRAAGGDRAAFDDAVGLVYDELRMLARAQLRRERRYDGASLTLETGALVHEAYLRLGEGDGAAWDGRGHFLAIAATAMRRVLVDHARRAHAAKRGGTAGALPLEIAEAVSPLAAPLPDAAVVELDEALARLAMLDERQARVVECRFFGGLTETETAEALGTGLRTVKRDWAKARAWLFRELHPSGDAGAAA